MHTDQQSLLPPPARPGGLWRRIGLRDIERCHLRLVSLDKQQQSSRDAPAETGFVLRWVRACVYAWTVGVRVWVGELWGGHTPVWIGKCGALCPGGQVAARLTTVLGYPGLVWLVVVPALCVWQRASATSAQAPLWSGLVFCCSRARARARVCVCVEEGGWGEVTPVLEDRLQLLHVVHYNVK